MLKTLSIIITLLFLALGIFLGVLNPGMVKFDLIYQVVELPLSILLAITFSLGMLLAGLYFSFLLISKQLELRKAHKTANKLSNEIVELNKQLSDAKHQTALPTGSSQEVTPYQETTH